MVIQKLNRHKNCRFIPMRYKYLAVFFLLEFASSKTHAQIIKASDSLLMWNTRKLIWSDFKGISPQDRKALAITHSIVSSGYSYIGDTIEYYVNCRFFRYKSWTVTNTPYALNHEQKHFDIAEIKARWIRKYYSSLTELSEETHDEIVMQVRKFNNQGSLLQDAYDVGTDFGRDTVKQKQWDIKIQKMLDSLDAYKNPAGTVILQNK